MRRFHVHVGVENLDASIRFYANLFASEPSVRKDDDAKWMLDDPRINFAISQRPGTQVGLDHLGLQTDTAAELADLRNQFAAANGASVRDEPNANCCYALSDKHWVTDPQGIPWEAFRTLDRIEYFNGTAEDQVKTGSCCTPAVATSAPPKTGERVQRSGCCG
jgi:catechol 2,3-dioxygenase-like lactoylglutathione lyase family enzyme